jgi:hypothetical protein
MRNKQNSNANAKEKLVNAIEKFISERQKEPKKATIPRGLAYDFCKFGRNELGDLADELFRKGPKALDGKTLFGVKIVVPSLSKNVREIKCD